MLYRRLLLPAAPAALLLGSQTRAADKTSPTVGTWRMLSFYEEESDTKIRRDLMGGHPTGFIQYTSEGRMAVLFVDGDRKAPSGGAATDDEAVKLYRSMLSYMGRYTIEGDKVFHHIEVAWNQSWVGTTQTRHWSVKGDSLWIRTAALVSPFTGHANTVGTIEWERVKPSGA